MLYFLRLFTFCRVKMTWPAAWHRVLKQMPRSKKFTNNFHGKIRTFWEYFTFLCQTIQKYILVLQFTKFFKLERTMNSLCDCVARRFANQGAQNLRDVYGSLQRFPCHANPIRVTFSHFGGAAKFTDPHFAYYLGLEKKKGALERKMNHSLPFRTL